MSHLEAGHSPPKKWLYRIENSNTIRRPHMKLSGGSSNLVNQLDVSRNSRNLSGFPKKHSSFQSSNHHIANQESSPPKMVRTKLLPDIIFNKEKSVVTVGSKDSNQRISPLHPSVGRPSYQNVNRKLSTFLDQSAQKPFARHVSPYGNQARGTRGIYFPSTPSLNPEEVRLKNTSETPMTLRGEVRRLVSLHEKLVPIGGDAFSGRSSSILQPNESMNTESNDHNQMPVIHEQSVPDIPHSKEESAVPEPQQNYISVDQEISQSTSRQQPLNPRPMFKISNPPRVVDLPPFVESTRWQETMQMPATQPKSFLGNYNQEDRPLRALGGSYRPAAVQVATPANHKPKNGKTLWAVPQLVSIESANLSRIGVESVGVASRPGRIGNSTKLNQDSYLLSNQVFGRKQQNWQTVDEENQGLFCCVFDGHGLNGHRVSNFLGLNLAGRLA